MTQFNGSYLHLKNSETYGSQLFDNGETSCGQKLHHVGATP